MLANVKKITEIWTNEHGRECVDVYEGSYVITTQSTNMGNFYVSKNPGRNDLYPDYDEAIIIWDGASPYISFK